MNVAERREAIVKALIKRGSDKVANLAFEFDVSEKTIRNDIVELSFSYPIYTETGRYSGGVYIDPEFRMRRKYLKPEEIELLQKLSRTLSGHELETMQGIISHFSKAVR